MNERLQSDMGMAHIAEEELICVEAWGKVDAPASKID